jgi:hypothetical protein
MLAALARKNSRDLVIQVVRRVMMTMKWTKEMITSKCTKMMTMKTWAHPQKKRNERLWPDR